MTSPSPTNQPDHDALDGQRETAQTGGLQVDNLYAKIDDLVRNHDRREPYITHVVQRLYDLTKKDFVKRHKTTDYQRGYAVGYAVGRKKK